MVNPKRPRLLEVCIYDSFAAGDCRVSNVLLLFSFVILVSLTWFSLLWYKKTFIKKCDAEVILKMDPIISNLKMESNKTGKELWKYMIASKGLFPFHLQCCVLVKSFNISSIRHGWFRCYRARSHPWLLLFSTDIWCHSVVHLVIFFKYLIVCCKIHVNTLYSLSLNGRYIKQLSL